VAFKKVKDNGEVDNNTDTELDILKNLEKSFYNSNPSSLKRNTIKSLKWFSKYVPKNFSRVRTARMFRDRDLWSDKVLPGRMYFFEYDAIHKDTLPVWDRYPMIFPWDTFRAKNGDLYMLGINLHYLPPTLRFHAMKSLLTLRNEKRYRANTKLRISWEILKGLSNSPLFEHSIKMYSMKHVKSKFVEIPARSWEMAVFLPLARWQSGSKTLAWKMK
jgi:hypothetical protein